VPAVFFYGDRPWKFQGPAVKKRSFVSIRTYDVIQGPSKGPTGKGQAHSE
jgi:hypothetical protein